VFLNRLTLSDELRAGDKQHTQFVGVHAFDHDFAKLAGPYDG
jgi:hypothetical protein